MNIDKYLLFCSTRYVSNFTATKEGYLNDTSTPVDEEKHN